MTASFFYPAPDRAPDRGVGRTLLVMLPGVGSEAEEFAAHGFIAAVQDAADRSI